MRRIEIEPRSDLDRALIEAENTGDSVELVHGGRAYLLQLVRAAGPDGQSVLFRRSGRQLVPGPTVE